MRGQLTACILLSVLYSSGLMLVGLRLAVPIGFITGMLAFVPYVGFGLGLSHGGRDGASRLARAEPPRRSSLR